MAQRGVEVDQERFCCSICLDLLKDPVTIPCGHSYCMNCIKQHWDGEGQKKSHSCPQCRQSFTSRPVLVKNTMLADLVEELKKTGLDVDPCDAGPGDVACDMCTEKKVKASRSCLQCLASYCEKHLQPHYESLTFQKHKLVETSAKPRHNICPQHSKEREIFCRTDQQCICYLCFVDQHQGHDTVSAAAERTERQRELQESRQKIQQRIQHRDNEVKLLQQEVEAIGRSADQTLENSEEVFNELICLLDQRRSEVKQQIRIQQETEVGRVKELQEKLQQEVTELKRKDAELEQLSHTQDHIQFLHNYPSLSELSGPTRSSSTKIHSLRHFEDMTAAVSKLREQIQQVLSKEQAQVSPVESDVKLSLLSGEPTTSAGFLKYSWQFTLDPNTVNKKLLLTEGNTKVRYVSSLLKPPSYSPHPDRFAEFPQVLSRESVTGRCYWQVKWTGSVLVTMAYKNISRTGSESLFGNNDKSWTLYCDKGCYTFRHNRIITSLRGPRSSRVGVYLDYSAGVLCFYNISNTMTLLHRVQTTFTQPLFAGFGLGFGSVEVCDLQ